ncbi:MAG TPA: hypothetical protein PKC28_04405 [Bdellovibrionales bacterium]|mgnify:CR=1 FL=1|nr:hypothetical protein [Bdellovibrionales bacterium]
MRVLILLPFVLAACASTKPRDATDEAIRLELKGKPGEVTDTRYFSNSRVRTFTENQLIRDHQEAVDFTVRTDVKSYDANDKILKFKVTTTKKDGPVPLHDLAFPEYKESVDFVVHGASGKVLSAGSHSPQGIFFVPSLPLPSGEVKVGDTWTMDHVWYSASEGIPMKLDVVAIFKDIMPCGSDRCADIEISGNVKIAPGIDPAMGRFESRIWGRLLFAVGRGEVVWSEMRNQEQMLAPKERMDVVSCMLSETKLTKEYRTKFDCTPDETLIQSVPKL